MPIPQLLLTNLGAIALTMLLLWIVSLAVRRVDFIDGCWGLGFVMVAWISVAIGGESHTRAWLLAGLVTVWGMRLSGYLAWRIWGSDEDHRYAAMREKNPQWFPYLSLFKVFLLQGAVMWIVALPLQMGVARPTAVPWLVAAGCTFWVVGLFFEAVGDFQLARFKSNPANDGQVMDRGLWRYTRHPNYFGDFMVWWGNYLIAFDPGSWWWTITGPLLLSFLLLRVSGVTLLESSLRERKPRYEDYVRRTSSFFPLPPSND